MLSRSRYWSASSLTPLYRCRSVLSLFLGHREYTAPDTMGCVSASGGKAPTFNGAWGKLHVLTGLMQQFRTDVGHEMAGLEHPTVYDKRAAWNKRVAHSWQDALRENAVRYARWAQFQPVLVTSHHWAAHLVWSYANGAVLYPCRRIGPPSGPGFPVRTWMILHQ